MCTHHCSFQTLKCDIIAYTVIRLTALTLYVVYLITQY